MMSVSVFLSFLFGSFLVPKKKKRKSPEKVWGQKPTLYDCTVIV